MSSPTRAARILFVLLGIGTVAAFFVAQRLKNEPSVIQGVRFLSPDVKRRAPQITSFSPNQVPDGRLDTIDIRFKVDRTTPVTVEIVDSETRTVRTIVRNRLARRYRVLHLSWDGRTDDGQVARDGRYKLKITLPDEGRSVVNPTSFTLDTTPPRPKVRRIGPQTARGPEILPSTDGRPAEAELILRGWHPTARVVRIAPGPMAVIRPLDVTVTRHAAGGTLIGGQPRAIEGRVRWDGTLESGRPAPAGSYAIQVCVRDQAGNDGCSPTASGRDGLPQPEPNGRLRGRGGITIRDIAVQPSTAPTSGDHRLTFFVDARGRRYHWILRRVGDGRRVVARGSGREPLLRPRTGSARAAAYRLAVSVDAADGLRRIEVPAIATDARPQKVLVVLPAISWQGGNPVDDDGDGLPNTLEQGATSRVRAARVMFRMPRGFDQTQQPVLEWLARHGMRFDLTTDLALAAAEAEAKGTAIDPARPRLAGHSGVLLVGEHRWTTGGRDGLAGRLQRFVRDGGTVAVLDPASLHRTVDLRDGVLRDPGRFTDDDAFGFRSSGAIRLSGPLQIDRDALGLFRGTDGRFDRYPVGWPAQLPAGAGRESSAVDDRDRLVIAGARIGKGLVIRTGLPTFPERLGTDADTSELMSSTWRRLSR